jgi:hypothetical protein
MGPYPEVVGKCTRKRLFGFGKICGGDIVGISKARTTASGELLFGPGVLQGYQCKKCKKRYDQPPPGPRLVEAFGF